MSVRDSQRSKLYKAERAAWKDWPQRDVSTHTLFDNRVHDITRSEWMKDYAPRLYEYGVIIKFVPQRRGAVAWAREIHVGPKVRLEWVLMHELAHCVNAWVWPRWDLAAHGRQYAMIYLDLVRRFMGQAAHDKLKASFKAHGVKYKKKKVLSDETRARLSARLTTMHDARRAIQRTAPGVSYPPGALTPG